MAFSINLHACRQLLNVHMITTTSSRGIEWRLKDNTKFFKDSLKERKRKQMNN